MVCSLTMTERLRPLHILIQLTDRIIQAVIVTIRGTLSLEDCISDALADAASLQAAGFIIYKIKIIHDSTYIPIIGEKWGFDGSTKFAHSGMLRAAMWIRNDLESSGLLTDLLVTVGGAVDSCSVEEPSSEVTIRRPTESNAAFRSTANLHTPLNKVGGFFKKKLIQN